VPPSHAVAVAALGVAVVLVLGIWELTGHVATIAHEGAHAAAILIVGGTVRSVTLEDDLTGETKRRDLEGVTLIPLVAGYYGPPLFGLLGAALLVHGSPTGVLWIYLLLLGLLLLVVRNVFGFLVVLGSGALLYLTVTYGSAQAQAIVACTWVWLLLLGGVVVAFEHFRGGSDYRTLQSYTKVVPRFVWATLGVLVAGGCLVLGGAWLLGCPLP
jgi:Peptidase M50B-like